MPYLYTKQSQLTQQALGHSLRANVEVARLEAHTLWTIRCRFATKKRDGIMRLHHANVNERRWKQKINSVCSVACRHDGPRCQPKHTSKHAWTLPMPKPPKRLPHVCLCKSRRCRRAFWTSFAFYLQLLNLSRPIWSQHKKLCEFHNIHPQACKTF